MKLIFALLVLILSFGGLTAQTTSLEQYIESCPFLGDTEKKTLLTSAEHQDKILDAIYYTSTSSLSDCSIRLYPMVNGTPLIGVIERISEPSVDCSLRFYTPEWDSLPLEQIIELPIGREYMRELEGDSSPEAERIRQLLHPLHYLIQWSKNGSIVISASLPLSQEDEEQQSLKALIAKMPTYTFEWKNYRFVRQD